MYEKYGLYYFLIMETELIKPNFPQEFDVLIIDYFEETCTIKRNKVIDKFLRKSNKVYKRIENYYDKYTLRFLLDGKEIYKFYYSDVGYPEKAVKLMKSILIEYASFWYHANMPYDVYIKQLYVLVFRSVFYFQRKGINLNNYKSKNQSQEL